MSLQTEKIFHNLTLEQVQELDKVLTEIIPIYGRGNFPTLEVKAKDIIRVVRDRLVERDIQVKDIRLNGSTASHVMVRDNGMGYRDLDIIFGVELPRQEDLKVIKEVVLGSLRDLLPCGVNRRKITWLTMKEAYVQKMVKVFNEHDRWSLISLSNSRSKTVGLRFVSSLRRQFEFSVDSFQIILDHMLESYWETEKKQEAMLTLHGENLANFEKKELEEAAIPQSPGEDNKKDSTRVISEEKWQEEEEVPISAKETSCLVVAAGGGREQVIESPMAASHTLQYSEADDKIEDIDSEGIVFHLSGERMDEKAQLKRREHFAVSSQTLLTEIMDPLAKNASSKLQDEKSSESRALSEPSILHSETFTSQKMIQTQSNEKTEGGLSIHRSNKDRIVQDSHREFSFPPPAKKTCSTSQDIIPGYCHSPILQRKMSHKTITKPPLPEKWSLLSDPSDFTTQLIQPIEIPKTIQPKLNSADVPCSNLPVPVLKQPEGTGNCENHMCHPVIFQEGSSLTQAVKPKNPKKPPDSNEQSHPCVANTVIHTVPHGAGPGLLAGRGGNPTIGVKAECMYGNFEQALNHLRHRLITTHGPEEIRGGGLLKYSDLLVRNFRPASEIEIKSLERYMCSRFFIDFPDVAEQQRKIEAYLQCHFIGNEEASKYDYLMTLRCVIDESTVCLMGHERRQTLNMITVLALRVLGEQNAIPNTANVTCFYQPAPYMADLMFSSYYFAHAQHPLVYHPYPLHVHIQTGLV